MCPLVERELGDLEFEVGWQPGWSLTIQLTSLEWIHFGLVTKLSSFDLLVDGCEVWSTAHTLIFIFVDTFEHHWSNGISFFKSAHRFQEMHVEELHEDFVHDVQSHGLTLRKVEVAWCSVIVNQLFLLSLPESLWNWVIGILLNFLVESDDQVWVCDCSGLWIFEQYSISTFLLLSVSHTIHHLF